MTYYRWEFSTEGKDIGCGLFRLKDKHGNGGHTKVKHMEELRPIERVNCHLVPEDGSYSCDQPGECKSRIFNDSATGDMPTRPEVAYLYW